MLRISKEDKQNILRRLYAGEIDAMSLSTSSLVDDIILSIHNHGLVDCLKDAIPEKRADNITVPLHMVFLLAIAAKMRTNTSLTDIPFALQDHRTICELGYSMYTTKGNIDKGLMREGTIRHLIEMYQRGELISLYNKIVQNYILPKMDIDSNIHILDCTKVRVNLKNEHYEKSGIVRDEDGVSRGYKIATLRGVVNDSGVIEEINFGAINIHDLELSRNMIMTTPMLKRGDCLICDRGFLSRELVNYLKNVRGVDTYVPLRKNMEAYELAIAIAHENNSWEQHPHRKNQQIAFVPHIENYWRYDDGDVPTNACVVKGDDGFCAVFTTTDTTKTAADIIKTYEIRPEIEEDFRQIKDFWRLEEFKSTKLVEIEFHIFSVLMGYLFYQLYMMLPEGEQFAGRSLPVLIKNYQPKALGHVVVYTGNCFGVFSILELMEVYSNCAEWVKSAIASILKDFGRA